MGYGWARLLVLLCFTFARCEEADVSIFKLEICNCFAWNEDFWLGAGPISGTVARLESLFAVHIQRFP